MINLSKQRVVIDFKENGDFFIYSDPEVEVICREEHKPEDELYRYGSHPIPEEWLSGKPFGFKGDGPKTTGRRSSSARPAGRPGCLGSRCHMPVPGGTSVPPGSRSRPDDDIVTVHVPMAFRKRGGRKIVVTPDGAPWASRPRVDNAMVKALARAFRWQRMLDEGDWGRSRSWRNGRGSTAAT